MKKARVADSFSCCHPTVFIQGLVGNLFRFFFCYLPFLSGTYGKSIHVGLLDLKLSQCKNKNDGDPLTDCTGQINHFGSGAAYTSADVAVIRNKFEAKQSVCYFMDANQADILEHSCFSNPPFTCVLDCQSASTNSKRKKTTNGLPPV